MLVQLKRHHVGISNVTVGVGCPDGIGVPFGNAIGGFVTLMSLRFGCAERLFLSYLILVRDIHFLENTHTSTPLICT